MTQMINHLYGVELEFILILAMLKRFTYKSISYKKMIAEILNLIQKPDYFQINKSCFTTII